MEIKVIEDSAKRVASLSEISGISLTAKLLRNERKNNFLVDCLYDDFIDRYWHYMSFYYKGESV